MWFHHRKCVVACCRVLTVVTNPSGSDKHSSRSRRPCPVQDEPRFPSRTGDQAALLAGLPTTGPHGCAFFPRRDKWHFGTRRDLWRLFNESITSAWLQQPAPGSPTSTSCTRSWGSEFASLYPHSLLLSFPAALWIHGATSAYLTAP